MNKTKPIRYEDTAILTEVAGWVCTECQRFWGDEEHMARWCCATDLPCDCGQRHTNLKTKCDECLEVDRQNREKGKFNKAGTVDYDGNPFIVRGEFYEYLDDYEQDVQEGTCEPAEFAFMTVQLSLTLSAHEIWESAQESLEISSEHSLEPDGWEEFHAAVEKFESANQKLNYWQEDNSRKFILPKVTKKG